MIILLFFAIHWYASLFFTSVFHHRYAAHRTYSMRKGWERLFFLGSFLTQGSSYISPRSFGIMHRLHHLHADTPNDPHSPLYHSGLWRVMLQTRNSYHYIHTGNTVVSEKIRNDVPRWDAFDAIAHNWITRLIWIGVYIAIYIRYASSPWLFALLPFTIIMSTLHGALVNWWAHRFGYRNYPVADDSRNILPVDFLMLGEAYHNNHHKFPGRPKLSHRWFEVDPGYQVLRVLDLLGIIRLNQLTAEKPRDPA